MSEEIDMRRTWPRLTIRRLMLVVGLIAVVLSLWAYIAGEIRRSLSVYDRTRVEQYDRR